MAKDANGKLTYEMVSPGEAFQDHVEKHHNASAATPTWLEGSANKNPSVTAIEKRLRERDKNKEDVSIQQDIKIEQKPGKEKGISR